MHGLAHQQPADVRPPLAVARGMGITITVGKLMMDAMRSHPENRTAFERQRGAQCQKIFHPLGSLVAAMRQQPVVAHADAPASGHPPQQQRNEERFPGEKNSAAMAPTWNKAITEV